MDMTTQRVDYHHYMASREWALKKRAVRERSGGECERCQRPSKQVHHLSYQNLGHEPLTDLLDVCKWCHEYLSAVRDVDPVDVNDWEFFKGFRYEDNEDGDGWDPLPPENNFYQDRWGTSWQNEMRERYGRTWGTILNDELIMLGGGILFIDPEDNRRFAKLPAIF